MKFPLDTSQVTTKTNQYIFDVGKILSIVTRLVLHILLGGTAVPEYYLAILTQLLFFFIQSTKP